MHIHALAFQGMDSSLLQSKFHLDNDSNYVTFCRKIFQWVTKGEDVRSFHNGSKILFSVWNEHAYTNRTRLENDMDRIIYVFGQPESPCLTFLLTLNLQGRLVRFSVKVFIRLGHVSLIFSSILTRSMHKISPQIAGNGILETLLFKISPRTPLAVLSPSALVGQIDIRPP